MKNLKERIIEKFGSINNFYEVSRTTLSKTQIYYMLNHPKANPTIKVMSELARVTNVPIDDITKEFQARQEALSGRKKATDTSNEGNAQQEEGNGKEEA